MNYTITHIHTMLSNGVTNVDSVTSYDEYIKRAKELGMKAIAFTEHGSVFEWYKKKTCCEDNGLKYIHAEEFYVTKQLTPKVRDNYHCCLYALNYDGVKELNKLSSLAFEEDHKYYNPRITFDELIKTSNNIAITTACVGGILASGDEELEGRFIEFLSNNKHRCFLEIQHHNTMVQKEHNEKLFAISKKYNIPMIVSTDTHALNSEHVKGRDIMQKAKKINFDNENGWDLTLQTYEQLISAFKYHNNIPSEEIIGAIENTNKLANMVEEFELDTSYKYPRLWNDSMALFKEKIKQGVLNRGVNKYHNYKEYVDRIRSELEAYVHNGAVDFMLLMEDIISWCKTVDIEVGYGRGSCNGSIIAYLLGITEMDSIKYGLNFERFMNVERVSLADIDTDFPPSRIEEVRDYVYRKTGLYCCDIITFNTVAMKGAIRDVGRALEIPLDVVGNICSMVETQEDATRAKYPELFEYVDIVNGTIVSVGTHPCGLVCSGVPLDDWFGTCRLSTCKNPVSQIYMKEIDALNFVKLDLLALDTIEVINETCKLANIDRLTPDNIDTSDMNVWADMRDDTCAVFQWEGSTGDRYIKKLLSDDTLEKFSSILGTPKDSLDLLTLLTIGNSAIRPAGASYRDSLANGVVKLSGSSAIDEFLKSTFGYLVFQCQIIEFLHRYCGFTMGEADIVRRHFAKKTGTEKDIPIIKYGGYMDENNKSHYIKGFISTMQEEYNQTKEEAEQSIVAFLQVIIDASRYLFSLNHSQPYSLEGYACAWLRYHYALEFLTTSLNINKDKEEKTNKLIEYALKRGISINNPIFRKSKGEYFFDKDTNSIYKGIGSIKFMNSQVGEELYELRNDTYTDFIDLLFDINSMTSCNSKQLDILIKLDFFKEFGSATKLLKCVEVFNTWINKKTIPMQTINDALNATIHKYATNISEKTGKETKTWRIFDKQGFIKHLCEDIEDSNTGINDIIKWQTEILGYVTYIDNSIDKRVCVVQSIDGKTTRKVRLYCLNNGKSTEVKIQNKVFSNKQLSVGDIIYLGKFDKKAKAVPLEKDDNGKVLKWGKDNSVMEWWLTDYSMIN